MENTVMELRKFLFDLAEDINECTFDRGYLDQMKDVFTTLCYYSGKEEPCDETDEILKEIFPFLDNCRECEDDPKMTYDEFERIMYDDFE